MADNQSYNVGTVEITLKTQMDEASKRASSVLLQLNKLKSGVKDTKREIVSTSKSSKDLGSNLKKAFDVGKAYVALNYIRRYARVLTGAFKLSIDYTETLNKFEVSMDRMFNKAVKFQNQLNETFGVSKSELMDYQANFNNIVKAMGDVTDEQAYNLSEKLTEMALDFASLFNTSTESAMSKFQAALTQQVRPIRSVSGFDITQSTMGGVLSQIGITDRTVQQLSQVEKRLLTIITLQRQMEAIGARGDLARTIEQPANQLKVMQQTLKDLAITFGNFVMYDLAPAFKYINGLLMALKEIFQYMYTMIPKTSETTPNGSLDDILKPDKATSGIKGTEKAVKDLKKATVGIDELNIISPQTDTGGGGGVGTPSGIDPRLMQALKDYDNQMEKTKMKATEIRDKIMEWLGFTKEVDSKTGEVNFKLDDGYTKFEAIIDILKIIGETVAILFTGKVLTRIIEMMGGKAKEGTVIFALFACAGAVESVKKMFEGWNEILSGDTTNNLKSILKFVGGATGLTVSFLILKSIIEGKKGLTAIFGGLNGKLVIFVAFASLAVGLAADIINNWKDMSPLELATKILLGLSAALGAAAVAAMAFHASWSGGLMVAGIIAGVLAGAAVIMDTIGKAKNWGASTKKMGTLVGAEGYATGGFPSRGDYFLANENGVPEYVGSMGGKTAVANTNQIVDGISIGVYKANAEQNRLLQEQNAYLRKIAGKEFSTYLDGRKVSNQLKKTEDERGYNAVVGGFAYG